MTSTPNKNSWPLPAIVVGVALLGGAMFVLGRNSVPIPLSNTSTSEHDHQGHEHNHEEGQEETQHAEAGHEEHAEGGEGHEEHGEGEAIEFSPEALKSAQISLASVVLKPRKQG